MSTSLGTYHPFSDLGELRDRLDRVFDDLTSGGQRSHRLAVDVVDEDDRYLMRADVPGIKPDDVKVEIEDSTLTVSGSHEERTEEKEDNYVRRERRCGSFSRSMVVPQGTDASSVEASMSDGVLEISIPKPKGAERHGDTVEIKPKSEPAQ
jgi:HSP20 family protein